MINYNQQFKTTMGLISEDIVEMMPKENGGLAIMVSKTVVGKLAENSGVQK